MEQRKLGSTGLTAGIISLGALSIGRDWGLGDDETRRRPNEQGAAEVLRGALEVGVNLIDTASAYHRSEERIGLYLSEKRAQYLLATKCGEHNKEPDTYYDYSYEAIRRSIDRSLALLKTEYIDILQIHFGPDPDKVLDDGGCVRAMKEAQKEGRVRFLGASVDGPVLERCIDSGDFQIVQVGYSLLNQAEEKRIERAHSRGMGVLIRSGLARGWLTPRLLSVQEQDRPQTVKNLIKLCGGDLSLLTQIGLHFLMRNKGISSILVGTKSLANIRQAIQITESFVDEKLLDKAIDLVRKNSSA
jgi:aryl-alcohol dehydrogenase-like predicted oxidoreductase